MEFNRIYMAKSAFESIQIATEKSLKVETGGVLMGYYSRETEVVITHASFPGAKAKRKRRSIEFDSEFCQSFVDDVFQSSEGYFTYVGDWHSHTANDLSPSSTDRRQLKKTAEFKAARLSYPVMLITHKGKGMFKFASYGFLEEKVYRIDEVFILNQDVQLP